MEFSLCEWFCNKFDKNVEINYESIMYINLIIMITLIIMLIHFVNN